jgi:hypothetical protein
MMVSRCFGKNNELKIQFFGSKKLSTCFFGHHSGQKMDNTDDVLSIFFSKKSGVDDNAKKKRAQPNKS